MPDWNPLPDVDFDFAAAANLVHAASAAEAGITEAIDQSHQALDVALTTWAGQAQRIVADRLASWRRSLELRRSDLATLAQKVAAASSWAVDEQARRHVERQRWAAELAAEVAAEALAEATGSAVAAPR